MRRKILKLTSVVAIIFIFTSCTTTSKWTYPPDPTHLIKLYDTPKLPLKIAVLPFKDNRRNHNTMATLYLGYIPLFPFGYVEYDRPDTQRAFVTIGSTGGPAYIFNPPEDVAKAVTRSLNESGIFKEAYFSYGGDETADLILSGEVDSTLYNGKIFTYGLSFVGPCLWSLGLPSGSSNNELEVKLSLLTRDNKKIWEYNVEDKASVLHGRYYNWGFDNDGYAEILLIGMNKAIQDLNEKIISNKLLLK
ncbi:MAG: hypothetical protein HZA77_11810 [Candidatus Schekmanbacteria bacterium]|nr:hypothetical protein [Candidatus Schekmanbacteria bacterium]